MRHPDSALLLDEIYRPHLNAGVQRHITDLATAELVKLSTNAFLATKISFVNTVSRIAAASGADARIAAELLGGDPRIGPSHMRPGLGYGGGCLPKDTRGLAQYASHIGAAAAAGLFESVDAVNISQRQDLLDLILEQCAAQPAPRIAILGASFKPDTDDTRDSPSSDIARSLDRADVRVRIADPVVSESSGRDTHIAIVRKAQDAMEDATLTVLATGWNEYQSLDPDELISVVRRPIIIDARGALDSAAWQQAGWHFRTLFDNHPHN